MGCMWVYMLKMELLYSGLIFTTAQVVFVTAKIAFIFTPLSAVQIYDFHIFTVTLYTNNIVITI